MISICRPSNVDVHIISNPGMMISEAIEANCGRVNVMHDIAISACFPFDHSWQTSEGPVQIHDVVSMIKPMFFLFVLRPIQVGGVGVERGTSIIAYIMQK